MADPAIKPSWARQYAPGVDDRETVSALDVNIDITYMLVFVLSAVLVGIAGRPGGTYLQALSRQRYHHASPIRWL